LPLVLAVTMQFVPQVAPPMMPTYDE